MRNKIRLISIDITKLCRSAHLRLLDLKIQKLEPWLSIFMTSTIHSTTTKKKKKKKIQERKIQHHLK